MTDDTYQWSKGPCPLCDEAVRDLPSHLTNECPVAEDHRNNPFDRL